MYGLIVTCGIFIAVWFAEQQLILAKKNPEILWNGLFWALFSGVAGARLYHVLDFWQYYMLNPLYIPQIWRGGLGIIGGIIGGLIGLLLYFKTHNISAKEQVQMLDIAALCLPLGQFVGRFANYFNQELYGRPTNLPWAIHIDLQHRSLGFEQFSTFHPLFLYESLACLLIFMVLFYLKTRAKLLDGDILLLYLLSYGLLRFVLEPLRIAHWEIGLINVAQAISLFTVVGCTVLLAKRRLNN